eukprot:CAMPEP_0113899418 /NCGR_PEP_ID=MMETSP0780_2-20120614/20014_1 /TAXON_ID=652834 /ORGANISM="Palpitomonas bilix" /LENGTH=272 /DNA_ID=CAMNT_0000891571 /DNA_START=184 /DNA_END=1002 /DNA_ORIENTATION=- /assembly_acc=CAM_ASM_000599
MGDLRDYVVSGGEELGGMKQAESTVFFHITHSNLQAKFMEIRLDLHMTIASVKEKIRNHTGTAVQHMDLVLKDQSNKPLVELNDDTKMLGFYSPQNGYYIHVIDNDPHSLSKKGGLDDVSQVKKYTMSDEEYDKRENTYKKYKEKMRETDPTWTLQKEIAKRNGQPIPETINDPEFQKDEAEAIAVGKRCQVYPGDRRGEVMYVGKVEGLPLGYWVGVKYDEPVGKNDGSVRGQRYFECDMKYGAFIRPSNVTVGDFPPEDDELLLGDGDEM